LVPQDNLKSTSTALEVKPHVNLSAATFMWGIKRSSPPFHQVFHDFSTCRLIVNYKA